MGNILQPRRAFTLIDVLAILAISCILVALTLPAVQQSRESARRNGCRENLKKLGLAIYHYESTARCLPPTAIVSHLQDGTVWKSQSGPFVRLLPYFEQSQTYNAMNVNILYGELAELPVVAHMTRAFLCPSEPRGDQVADATFGGIGGVNYGFSMGDWSVANGTSVTSNSIFGANLCRRWSDFSAGLGQTVLMAEVKFQQPYLQDSGVASRLSRSGTDFPIDADQNAIAPEYHSARSKIELNGHMRWMDSAVEQIGFTTAWTPNRATPGGERNRYADVDLVGRSAQDEAVFAAVTSRSHHQGGVNCLFGDGSVRFVTSNVYGRLWRAAGSVRGSERHSSDSLP